MTTDETSTAVREPYDAMGPVDAPNPPAARATLATVKHGGCVQLATSERARFDAFLSGNPFMGLMAGTASQVWQAALSAKPSPGGQGDALLQAMRDARAEVFNNEPHVIATLNWLDRRAAEIATRQPVAAVPQGCDACDRTGIRQNDEGRNTFCPDCDLGRACAGDAGQPSLAGHRDVRAQFEEYRGGDCERDAQGYYVNARTAQDWAMWQAALAARQPVGEITDTEIDARLNALYREITCSGQHNGGMSGVAWDRAVYRMASNQPAQAVGLAAFKALYHAYVRLLESGRDRIIDLGGTCDPVDVMEANDVNLQAARRFLDSQAVGK